MVSVGPPYDPSGASWMAVAFTALPLLMPTTLPPLLVFDVPSRSSAAPPPSVVPWVLPETIVLDRFVLACVDAALYTPPPPWPAVFAEIVSPESVIVPEL